MAEGSAGPAEQPQFETRNKMSSMQSHFVLDPQWMEVTDDVDLVEVFLHKSSFDSEAAFPDSDAGRDSRSEYE